jgi:hypothetical protein
LAQTRRKTLRHAFDFKLGCFHLSFESNTRA